MSMSQSYGEADPQESTRTLHRALDLGVTFLDTANVYGMGHNEELLGQTLSTRRSEFVLASKFGIVRHADGRRGVDGHPDQVATRCEESLGRLRTDVIDLYYLHRLDPAVPIEDTVGAMSRLVEQGKVRAIGLSEVSAKTIRRAHAVHPITAVQSEYSLFTRDVEQKVLPTCAELGIGFVPFSPLGRAMLSARLTDPSMLGAKDLRADMPRFIGDNFTQNFALVQQLVAIAEQHDCSAAQLSLAWVLHKADTMVPIPGTKHSAFLEENLTAADLSLSKAVVAELDRLFSPDKIAGERYPAKLMQSIDRD